MKLVYIFVLLGAVLASPFFQQTFQLLFTGSLSRDNCYITVEGESNLYHFPENAELSIRIHETSNTKTKSEVIADVVSSSNQVEKLLKSYSDIPPAIKNDASTPISQKQAISHWALNSHTSGAGERYNRYRDANYESWAETRFDVHVQDFDKMGRLVTELQQIDHLEMQDIKWTVSERTAQNLQREARRAAVQDAKSKAWELAIETTGMDKGHIRTVDISRDDGYMPTSSIWSGRFRPASATVGGSYDEDSTKEELNFVPEKIRMTHSVQIKFVLENWGSVWPFTILPRFLFSVQPDHQPKML